MDIKLLNALKLESVPEQAIELCLLATSFCLAPILIIKSKKKIE